MTSIVGNVPPDAIHQDRFTIGDWASRGAFRPLDDLMARDAGKDPYTPRPDQYYEATWQEASYNGQVYAIPMAADNRALYWNRKIFREKAKELRAAGLDPERPPRTWSELLAYGKVLTEYNPDGKTLKRAGFLPNFGNSWLYMYAFQMNASFMSPDGRTCTLYTPEAEKALEFIVKGYDQVGGYENAKAFETGFQGGENDPFIIGKVAMKIDGDWIIGSLARYGPNLDFATAPPPVPDDRYHKRGAFANETETYVSWVGGFSYAIPNGARNVDGGWQWIKWATSTEARLIDMAAQRDWERRRGRTFVPRIQANKETNEKMFVQFKPGDPKFAEAVRSHIDLMPVSRMRPVTFVGQPLWDEHVRALEAAAMQRKSPEQALKDGQAVVQRELDAVLGASAYPTLDMRLPQGIGIGLTVAAVIGWMIWLKRQRLGPLARAEAKWAYLFIAPWL
ncbi:MAG: ABC transporter substrate-binding protein, partial [Nitrospirae bacterium]|nr:ABC transporter substrate-binding protein [Fimbriimonadaceae bacterium]